MGKIWSVIGISLLLITGCFAFSICFDYWQARSLEIGKVDDLEITEFVDSKDNYSISYNLDGGVVDNPTEYNMFTETFILNNPFKADGYRFIGWTNETLTVPTLVVRICKGSSGDVTFNANYELLLKAPVISIVDSTLICNSVENADYYQLCINDDSLLHKIERDNLQIDILSKLYYFQSGENSFKIRACMVDENETIYSAWSNVVSYEYYKQYDAPTLLSLEDNILTWSHDFETAFCNYRICFSDSSFITTSSSSCYKNGVYEFDLTNYKRYPYFTAGDNSITVIADSGYGYLSSEPSNSIDFNCEYFDDVELTEIYKHCSNCGHVGFSETLCPECNTEYIYSWQSVENADKYLIKVFDADDANVVIAEYFVEKNNLSFRYSEFNNLFTVGHRYSVSIVPISNSVNFVYYPKGITNFNLYVFN